MKIEKTTKIGELLEVAPEKAEILMECGMHCIGCPASQMETLEEACNVHGIDVNELLEKLEIKYISHIMMVQLLIFLVRMVIWIIQNAMCRIIRINLGLDACPKKQVPTFPILVINHHYNHLLYSLPM